MNSNIKPNSNNDEPVSLPKPVIQLNNVAKAKHARQLGLRQRQIDGEVLGWNYVIERDGILQNMGLDCVSDAIDYEENIRFQKRHEKIISELLINSSFDYKHEYKHEDSPNGIKIEDMLKTRSVAEVIDTFVACFDPSDGPPIFYEFAEQDQDDTIMQDLKKEFDNEYTNLMLSFLKKHSEKISKKALIGYAKLGISDLTFNKMI